MPDPRIKCGAGKSGMTTAKKKGFSKLFNIKFFVTLTLSKLKGLAISLCNYPGNNLQYFML
jgi:hypothetical protein